MDKNLARFTLRVEKQLLDKLAYISEYEGRTKNKEKSLLLLTSMPYLCLGTECDMRKLWP